MSGHQHYYSKSPYHGERNNNHRRTVLFDAAMLKRTRDPRTIGLLSQAPQQRTIR